MHFINLNLVQNLVFADWYMCSFGLVLFLDAVRRNPSTCRAVDTEVDKAIKDWLRFAADRHGGRQRRALKKMMPQCSNSVNHADV